MDDANGSVTNTQKSQPFFRRTDAPAFDPFGDGWWEQGYSAKTLKRYLPGRVLGRLRTLWWR